MKILISYIYFFKRQTLLDLLDVYINMSLPASLYIYLSVPCYRNLYRYYKFTKTITLGELPIIQHLLKITFSRVLQKQRSLVYNKISVAGILPNITQYIYIKFNICVQININN